MPRPRLANRQVASSFHLWWQFPAATRRAPLVEVSATCEVVVAPGVDSLYFWALQAGFHDGRQDRGAAHTGLQWHGRGSHRRAVNWGGYRAAVDGPGELAGSVSALKRLDQNGNTVAYPWQPQRPYRFRICRSDEGWRSTVTDLASGDRTVIRDLHAPGHQLVSPVVWSEVFAGCDAPSVTVRWSGLEAVTEAGDIVRPTHLGVSYQDESNQGCENTDVGVDDLGVTQTTNTERRVAAGARIAYPAEPDG
jgi:hypothetical protein